jgi:transcriptional regulator with XRE-family HTH domain
MAPKDIKSSKIDKLVSTKISTLRISKGMTRKELAKGINVTQQQVLKYEHGIDRISAGRLMLVAQVLSKDISYFFDGADSLYKEDIEDTSYNNYRSYNDNTNYGDDKIYSDDKTYREDRNYSKNVLMCNNLGVGVFCNGRKFE